MGHSNLNHTLTDKELEARQKRLQRKRKGHALTAVALTGLTVGTAFLFLPLLIITVPVQGAQVLAAGKLDKKARKCKKELKRRAENRKKDVSSDPSDRDEPTDTDINGDAPPPYDIATNIATENRSAADNMGDEQMIVAVDSTLANNDAESYDVGSVERIMIKEKKVKTKNGIYSVLDDDELESLEL